MPCSRGSAPVTKVDCTVVVTAGVTVVSGRIAPRAASALRFGACASSDWREPDDVDDERAFHDRDFTAPVRLAEQAGGQVAVHPEIVSTGTIAVSVNLANGAWMRRTVSMSGASSSV